MQKMEHGDQCRNDFRRDRIGRHYAVNFDRDGRRTKRNIRRYLKSDFISTSHFNREFLPIEEDFDGILIVAEAVSSEAAPAPAGQIRRYKLPKARGIGRNNVDLSGGTGGFRHRAVPGHLLSNTIVATEIAGIKGVDRVCG